MIPVAIGRADIARFYRLVAFLNLLALAAAHAQDQPTQGGTIRGRIVDPSDASLPAVVRIVQPDTGAVVARIKTDDAGTFQTRTLSAGTYLVTAGAPGFRRRDLPGIILRSGETTDIGAIRLQLAGCDAPGVICDYISAVSATNDPSPPRVSGNPVMRLVCTANLEESGTVICPGATTSSVPTDLQFRKEGANLYRAGNNGAALSVPNSTDTICSNAKFTESRIRVDGLGIGIDFCVRTRPGVLSHVFFIDDIEHDTSEIKLHVITTSTKPPR